jgi:hypothetical protein
MRGIRSAVVAALVLGGFAALVQPVGAVRLPASDHGGAPLSASLTGPVSNQTGTAALTANAGQQEVCFVIQVANLPPVTAAHIHLGAANVNGPIVVPLFSFSPPTAETSFRGCVHGDRDVITAILRNPSGYYVNVHTTQFPAGAIRGQLSLGG